ncbi:alpha/beta fold hydrolase [Pontixanthobacter aquaemixtae]|nr:alpha/beta hydrolase [Pontixanthobacter aquaemixtae]
MTRVVLPTGIELEVLDTGPRDAETLVFLHGFPENHRTWRHQIAHFSGRYRCIAPNQRGYAGSSNPQEASEYTIEKLMGDVEHMADALGVGKFTLVGHDLGGVVAWAMALTGAMKDRIKRLVIANAPHPFILSSLLYLNQHQRAASQYIRHFRDRENDAMIREHGLLQLLVKALDFEGAASMEDAERKLLLKEWANPDTAMAMINWYRAGLAEVPPMDAPYELPADYSLPPLPNVAIPTLIVWGMNDVALPVANLDGLDALVDDLTLEKVEGSGHFVTWEAPDKFNAALETFLTAR